LQTSDALGAAAAQLGPDAQAAIVKLNKQGGLSHGKVTRCLESHFGLPVSRGGSGHTVLRAASRCEPDYEGILQSVAQSNWVVPDETAGGWAGIRFGVTLRKVWGGSRTWAGARAQSVLMSVWRTCWQQRRSAVDFLSQLLRGSPSQGCATSGINGYPADAEGLR
jgi:hypothetical protein